jgi:hypothetical protein
MYRKGLTGKRQSSRGEVGIEHGNEETVPHREYGRKKPAIHMRR